MGKGAVAVVCAIAFVIAGCAQNKPIELDPRNLASTHRIIVVGPVDPIVFAVTTQREVNAQRAMAAAAAIPFFGVLGAAVAGGVAGAITAEIARETSKPLNDEIVAEHYQFGDALQDAMVSALKSDGYDVATSKVDRKAPTTFAEKYDAVKGQGDLAVDAVAAATCSDINSGDKSHFRPVVTMTVKVVRLTDNVPIMQKTFVYDPATAKPDAYQIKGDPQFDIADYDTLKGNIKQCLAGIKSSVTPLAQGLAAVIARQP